VKSVYLIGPVDGCYKIGQSDNPEARIASLNLPVAPAIVATFTTSRGGWLESYLHAAFAHRRTRGEWFRLADEEVTLLATVSHVSEPADLPAAVVALHDANRAAKKSTVAFSTVRVFKADAEPLAYLARARRQTAADVFHDLCLPLLNAAMVETIERQLRALDCEQPASEEASS
jgi:hypothetical protein